MSPDSPDSRMKITVFVKHNLSSDSNTFEKLIVKQFQYLESINALDLTSKQLLVKIKMINS